MSIRCCPVTRVRITGIDRAKIILPSLGGFLMSLRRDRQDARCLFAVIAIQLDDDTGWTRHRLHDQERVQLFQTKNRYQLNLTRNLYFQKLEPTLASDTR